MIPFVFLQQLSLNLFTATTDIHECQLSDSFLESYTYDSILSTLTYLLSSLYSNTYHNITTHSHGRYRRRASRLAGLNASRCRESYPIKQSPDRRRIPLIQKALFYYVSYLPFHVPRCVGEHSQKGQFWNSAHVTRIEPSLGQRFPSLQTNSTRYKT